MKKILSLLLPWLVIFCWINPVISQIDSIKNNFSLYGDFRFRIEQDWNGIDFFGQEFKDRSRLRIRARMGFLYDLNNKMKLGAQIRTGRLNDQQGPHLTLGSTPGEFGLFPIGFEKAYFEYDYNKLILVLGKQSFRFNKQNEIFWNDNVYPEGITIATDWLEETLKVYFAHFISRSSSTKFTNDSYLQLLQLDFSLSNTINLYSSYYFFKNQYVLPDFISPNSIDYRILNLGGSINFKQFNGIKIGSDVFINTQDYKDSFIVNETFKNEKFGAVFLLNLGNLEEKKDWLFRISYAYIQKYSIVDYYAQNDWARWDYSYEGAAGSRLSNFKGAEIRVGYALEKNVKLILRTYFVNQIKSETAFIEKGNRIRLDLDAKF